MKVFLKIIGVLLILLCLLAVVLLVLPDRQYQLLAQKVVKELTQRELTISTIKTNRSLTPSIEIDELAFANAQWAKTPEMVKAKNLLLSLDLREILQGRLTINEFTADSLFVDLVKNEQGLANWQFGQQDKTSKKFELQQLSGLALNKLDISQSQFEFRNEQTGLQHLLQLSAMSISKNSAADAQLIDANGVFNNLPFSIKGQAGLINSIAQNKTFPLDLTTLLNQTSIGFNGQLDTASKAMAVTGQFHAQTDSLTDLSVFTAHQLPEIGPISISADVAADLKSLKTRGLDVNNLKANVDDPAVVLNATGSMTGVLATNQGDMRFDLNVADLTKLSDLFGLKKQLPGRLNLRASAAGDGKTFAVTVDQLNLDSEFIKLDAQGKINDLLNGAGADVDIKLQAENLDLVTQLFGQKMPPEWGPITSTAKLTGKDGKYSLSDIQAEMNGASKVKANGAIDSLIGFNGMNLDVEASLATLKEISAFTPSPLPDMGPMNGTGKIIWQDGKLSLKQAQASYNGQYGQADVSGDIGDLIKFNQVQLKADASIPNLDVAEAFSGVQMPQVAGISATADLVSPSALDLSVTNLSASYDSGGIKVKATGSIDSMIKKRAELNLILKASAESLASVNPILNTNLPVIGPLSADARLVGATKNIQIKDLKGLVSDSVLYGPIEGDLGKVIDFKGINLRADLTTPSLEQSFARLGFQSNVKKPANLVSHVKYDQGTFYFDESELDIAGNKVIGDIALLNVFDKNTRPKVAGQVNVLNFDILDVTGRKLRQPSRLHQDKLLSDALLPYDFIENTDLDLKFNIGRLRGNIFDLANSSVSVRSTDGIFKMGPFNGKLSGGDAVFQLDINAKAQPSITSLNASIQGFDMAQAGTFRDSELINSSGDAFLNFALNAEGRTLASILANSNGGGVLYFEDLLMKKGTLDLFTSDLFRKTLNAINPFRKKQKDTLINCAGLAFQINNGLMSTPHGVAAEANDFSVTGNGQVDFKTEAIDLEFKTKVKKLLAINPLEKLTGLVKVTGEMATPEVTLNPKGILEIGATVGAALATGGLSFLAQDQLEKLQAKSELCAKAIGKAG